MITSQSLFDKVWNHFVVQQNQPGINKSNMCRYRGTNGAQCAFGILLPDEEYKPEMEGQAVTRLFEQYMFSIKFDDEMRPFVGWLRLLQRCHDSAVAESMYKPETHALFVWSMQENMYRLALDFSEDIRNLPARVVSEPITSKQL